MAGVDRQVGGCGGLIAEKSDHVEELAETHQVFEISDVAHAPAVDVVMHVGWAGYHAEVNDIAANLECIVRVATVHGESFGCACDGLHQQITIDAYDAVIVYLGAGLPEHLQRHVAHDFNALIFEQRHARLVDQADLFIVEWFNRCKSIAQHSAIQLWQRDPGWLVGIASTATCAAHDADPNCSARLGNSLVVGKTEWALVYCIDQRWAV